MPPENPISSTSLPNEFIGGIPEPADDAPKGSLGKLTDIQTEIFLAGINGKRGSRFRVVVAGRRSGKTHLSLTECVLLACRRPGANIFYLAPTYRQAKQVAWDALKAMIEPLGILARRPNESELTLYLTNGSAIFLKGVDNHDSATIVQDHPIDCVVTLDLGGNLIDHIDLVPAPLQGLGQRYSDRPG